MPTEGTKVSWTQGEEKEAQQRRYYDFIEQLNEYYGGGKLPSMASPDIKAGLTMQEKRLQENGIRAEHLFAACEKQDDRGAFNSLQFDSEKYRVYYNNQIVKHEIKYWKGDKLIGKMRDDRSRMYQYLFDLKDAQNVTESDTFCCPNCGAVSTLGELTHGCSYCGTKFTIANIFPVITHYFYNSKKNASIKGMLSILKYSAIIGAAAFLLISLLLSLIGGNNIFLALLTGIITGLVGAFFGYFIGAIGVFNFMLIKSLITMPVLMDTGGAKKKMESFMRQTDPYFSYDYFGGSAQALLRAVLLAENPEELSVYEGKKTPASFHSVLDSVYTGAMSLVSYRRENGFIYVDTGLYMSDSVLEGGRVKIKGRKYTVGFCRREDTQTDYSFSIHKVTCKGCGGSFDAALQKHCTFCGAEYKPEEDGWIIYQIKAVKDTPYLAFLS